MIARGVAMGMAMAAGVSAGGPAEAGWQALSRLRADEALQAFAAMPATQAREAQFGRAVALLAKQPVTAEQIAEAQRIFSELAGGSDDVAAGARYFLGRIAQHHLETPDPEAAAREYRQLIAEHPGSLWAQTALTRLALLELYDFAADKPAARVAEAERLLALARLPEAETGLHLVIADAIFYYGLPGGDALPHLLAAERLGQLDAPARADVLIQIAEISRLMGDRAQARRYYETYLAAFPLDQRRYMVKQRLAGL